MDTQARGGIKKEKRKKGQHAHGIEKAKGGLLSLVAYSHLYKSSQSVSQSVGPSVTLS